MTDGFLSKAYAARDGKQTRELYDEWSQTYDDEVAANGYITPQRCAEALARFAPDLAAPLLDFGCGTGLSGQALRAAGFTHIDGLDLSREMLGLAEQKGIYYQLRLIEAEAPLPFAPGDYAAIAAIGVIGAGAAPISVFDTLMRALAPSGLLVLSFNDHALENPENERRMNDWLDPGAAVLLHSDYGDHLPGLGLKSKVYVIEKR